MSRRGCVDGDGQSPYYESLNGSHYVPRLLAEETRYVGGARYSPRLRPRLTSLRRC
jgi:hypothetical protein